MKAGEKIKRERISALSLSKEVDHIKVNKHKQQKHHGKI